MVRGLDYYTNTAFEVHIPGLGAQSAIGGGGRYNGLVKECGGPDVPGIGFALGMERILLAMEASGRLIERSAALDVFIITMDDKFSRHALQLTNKIRQSGISADMDYNHRSPRAQMKFADKSNAKVVIMIGEEETEKGFYLVRNMQSREQYQIDQEDFIAKLQTILLKNEEEIG